MRVRAPGEPRRVAYLYLAPAFAFYLLFAFGPLVYTTWLSFFDWDGLTVGTWTGLDNYREVLEDPGIRASFVHSLVLIVFYALLPCALGLFLAALIAHGSVRGVTFFRAVLFLPQTIAVVVVAIAWVWIYAPDGPLNAALDAVGLGSCRAAGSATSPSRCPALGIVGTWMMFGLCLVLFLAGIQKIPNSLYEAARVDGAGRVREFFAVTLPGLRGELAVALTLTTIYALRTFDLVYVATSGGPGHVDDRAVRARLPERVLDRPRRAGGGGGGRAHGDHLRRRVRDHAARRPGPEPMTAARREQLLSYAVLGVFCVHRDLPDPQHPAARLPRAVGPGHRLLDPGLARLRHLQDAWEVGDFGRGLLNSFIVAATVTVVSAVLSTLAGYAFGAMRFRGSNALFYLLLIGLIFPYEATVIPLYYVFRDAGLTDSLWALILPADRPLGAVRHVLDARVLPLVAERRSSRPRGWTARRAS